MVKKIAIIFGDYDSYNGEFIGHSITDWSEVTDEEFKLITNNRHLLIDYPYYASIIEQPKDQDDFLSMTIQSLIEKCKAEVEKERKLKEQRDQKKNTLIQKKKAASIERAKKLLRDEGIDV